jgi:hypothetical protein
VFGEIKDYYQKLPAGPDVRHYPEEDSGLGGRGDDAPTGYYLEQLKDSYLRSEIEYIILRASKGLKMATPSEVLTKITRSSRSSSGSARTRWT